LEFFFTYGGGRLSSLTETNFHAYTSLHFFPLFLSIDSKKSNIHVISKKYGHINKTKDRCECDIGRAVAALETATAGTMPGRIADRIKGREFFVCRRYWKGSCGAGIGETIRIIIWAV